MNRYIYKPKSSNSNGDSNSDIEIHILAASIDDADKKLRLMLLTETLSNDDYFKVDDVLPEPKIEKI